MPGDIWPYLGAPAKESGQGRSSQGKVQGEAQPQILKSLFLEKEMQDPWWGKKKNGIKNQDYRCLVKG